MEGNRYNLKKAQEEAPKLTQNITSGEVSGYSESTRKDALENIRKVLAERDLDQQLDKVQQIFGVSDKDLESPDFIKWIKDGISRDMASEYIKVSKLVIKLSSNPVWKELLQTDDVKKIIKGGIISRLRYYKIFLFYEREDLKVIEENIPGIIDSEIIEAKKEIALQAFMDDSTRHDVVEFLSGYPLINKDILKDVAISHFKTFLDQQPFVRIRDYNYAGINHINIYYDSIVLQKLQVCIEDYGLTMEDVGPFLEAKILPFVQEGKIKEIPVFNGNHLPNDAINRLEHEINNAKVHEDVFREARLSKDSTPADILEVIESSREKLLKNWETRQEALQKTAEMLDAFNIQQPERNRILMDCLVKLAVLNQKYDILEQYKDVLKMTDENFINFKTEFGNRLFISAIQNQYYAQAAEFLQKFELDETNIPVIFQEAWERSDWRAVVSLARYFPICQTRYEALLNDQKNISSDLSQSFTDRRKAIEILSGLALGGDVNISSYFLEVLGQRSVSKDIVESKWSLDSTQEAAFLFLMRLDNPQSNRALFDLLENESISHAVKYAIIKKLIRPDRFFLNKDGKGGLKKWIYSKPIEEVDWRDLRFIRSMMDTIPSTELREKSLSSSFMIGSQSLENRGLYNVWQERFGNIPENAFFQLAHFCLEDSGLMDKFQRLYTSIRRENTKKDSLLYGIVNCLEISTELHELLINKLKEVDFGSKEDADILAGVLRKVVFLNSVQKIIQHSDYDEYTESDGENEQKSPVSTPDNIKEIFLRPITNLSELENLLSEAATAQIQEILPNEQITTEKVEKVIKQWGDIEPVFTYLKRNPNLKNYIAEMFANFDSSENWKTWRYNLENTTIKKQIGYLSSEQLEIWQNNHVAEVGDFEIQEGSSSKPEQVRRILIDAIVRDRHINNEQAEGTQLPFAQRILEKALLGLDENLEQGQKNLAEATKQVNDLASKLDVLILSANSSRVEQTLTTILPPDKTLTPSSKIENSLKALRPFLSPETFEIIWQTYKNIPEKTAISGSVLMSPDIRQALAVKLQDIKQQANEISNSTIWQELELPFSTVPEISAIYQKRAELKAISEILRLADLSPRQIALNILTEGKKKEEGTAISSTLENLKKVFKDCAFTQDLKNVEFLLKEQSQFTGKRRLAMVLSDNPSFLWQAGKYPIGNGSCQHYAEGSMSQSLMGYVGDAHIKVSYLFDINSLSENLKTKIKDGVSLGEIIDQAKPSEILQAVVARSIVKLGKDEQGKPAIFIEPTYSVINKGDSSMDRYFNLFTDLFVTEPMKSKLYRGSGTDQLSIPASRNPEGQYEDGADGNAGHAGMGIQTSSYTISAKLISKDYTSSLEEEIIENMRRSSY